MVVKIETHEVQSQRYATVDTTRAKANHAGIKRLRRRHRNAGRDGSNISELSQLRHRSLRKRNVRAERAAPVSISISSAKRQLYTQSRLNADAEIRQIAMHMFRNPPLIRLTRIDQPNAHVVSSRARCNSNLNVRQMVVEMLRNPPILKLRRIDDTIVKLQTCSSREPFVKMEGPDTEAMLKRFSIVLVRIPIAILDKFVPFLKRRLRFQTGNDRHFG